MVALWVPTSTVHLRWVVLLLASSLMFGNFFAYDLPASLNVPLKQYLGQEDGPFQYTINLLYSVYSVPNVFLPFCAGYLIDRFGSAKLTVALSLFQVYLYRLLIPTCAAVSLPGRSSLPSGFRQGTLP